MKTPLGSGRTASAKPVAQPREFLRPVLVSDEAAEEQRVIELVKTGDRAAFGLLVERHLPRAMAVAMRVLRHREDAEDLVQDAFLLALNHIADFDAQRRFWPWMSRIIVNRGLDVISARAVRVADVLGDDIADRGSSPASDAERSDLYARVRLAMSTLPRRRRLVIELFELEGMSVGEIAESLDSSPGTVRWHLHIARRQLRQLLPHVREDQGASA
jgi:RNA polymerase sigma-70 factor (ECF subfamily)